MKHYDNEGPGVYPELLSPSPSGMMALTQEGHDLLAEIRRGTNEAPADWVRRVRIRIPQLVVGESISDSEVANIERAAAIKFPEHLKEFWCHFPGAKLEYDCIVYSPKEVLEFNKMYPEFLPEIGETKLFFGGFDGHNFSVSLGNHHDRSVGEWEHEIGWTRNKAEDLYDLVAERIAWYVTYMTPFCYEHGYVSQNKYK